MKREPPIPKEDQLSAAAHGWNAIYDLLDLYDTASEVNALAYRTYFTITESELADFFRAHPQLAQKHVLADDAEEPYHETPILKKKEDGFLIYANDHGKPLNIREYRELCDAAAAYIFFFW